MAENIELALKFTLPPTCSFWLLWILLLIVLFIYLLSSCVCVCTVKYFDHSAPHTRPPSPTRLAVLHCVSSLSFHSVATWDTHWYLCSLFSVHSFYMGYVLVPANTVYFLDFFILGNNALFWSDILHLVCRFSYI